MKPKLLVFILGFIVGLLVALAVPPLVESWLPPGLLGGKSTTGHVVAKRLQEDRLLLTIESEDGAVLATFKERVPEIDLLVDPGDRVTLAIASYEPFVEDPRILGVKKGPGEGPSETRAETRAETPAGTPGAEGEELEPVVEGAAAEAGTSGPSEQTPGEEAPLPPMGPPLEDQPKTPPPR